MSTQEQTDLMEHRNEVALETLPCLLMCLNGASDDTEGRQTIHSLMACNLEYFTELLGYDELSQNFHINDALEKMRDTPKQLTPSDMIVSFLFWFHHAQRIFTENNVNASN